MKKILIVENHADMRQLLQIQVELRGFASLTAENGKEAVEKALAEKPDLILMDIMCLKWTVMRRQEFSGQLRRPKTFSSWRLPVRSMDLKLALTPVGNDYIVRPFTVDELLEKIKALI